MLGWRNARRLEISGRATIRPFGDSVNRSRVPVWPPLPPSVYVRPHSAPPPFPLGESCCALFACGRHALWHGVQALGLGPGDVALVPAYNCGTEIEALVQAGLSCRFYEASQTLEPDEAELDSLLQDDVRALFVIHYLGFAQRVDRWRRWCDERGILLIEDCAQAWLSTLDGRPLGSFGDLAIFSIYKTLGLADGGALVSRLTPSPPPAGRHLGAAPTARKHMAWLMARVAGVDRLVSHFEARRQPTLALGNPATGPSLLTRFLLPRLATPGAALRRRANYAALLDEFRERVPPPFATLPEGVCPLAFPLETRGTSDIAERLEASGVVARPLWPIVHPLLPIARFPGAAAWRSRFVVLPVHQELDERDLDRVATALRRLLVDEKR